MRRSDCSSGCWVLRTMSACSPRSTDPVARRQLGNFPQAFSHLSLVNTAYNLTHGQAGPAEQRRQ